MEPTFRDGSPIIMSRNTDVIDKNDIVVIEHEGELLIKRVIAVPDDTVELKDNSVYVNKVRVLSNCYYNDNVKYILSDKEYFVVGDNILNSTDSRVFGPVNASMIKYKRTGDL